MAKQKALLYVDKVGFDFYLESAKGNARFQFTPNAVKDLEVINTDILRNQIKTFTESGKIPPVDIIIIIAPSLIFQKDLQIANPSDEPAAVQKFIDTVPFDRVSSKVYKLGITTRVIATNKDLYNVISDAFEKKGSTTIAILPVHSLPKELQMANGSNVDVARLVIARIDSLKHNGMDLPQHILEINQAPKDTRKFTSIKLNRQSIILIGVFIGLGVILVILLVITTRPQTPNLQPTPIVFTPSPTIPQTLEVSSLSATLTIDELEIKITNRSSTPSQGTILKDQLESAGFKNITLVQQPPLATQSSQLILPSVLSEEVRIQLINEAEKLINNLSVTTADLDTKVAELIIGNSR